MALKIIATAVILALLYFGRDVLIPLTLAVILSLLLAPFARRLRQIGIPHTASVLLAVMALAIAVLLLAAVIASQVVRIAASLPEYEATIREKVTTVSDLTQSQLNAVHEQLDSVVTRFARPDLRQPQRKLTGQPLASDPHAVVPVEVRPAPPTAFDLVQRIFKSVWVPLETTTIVLIVLVFVLLEHEALRDRLIRLAGSTDLRATTNAINDAGERLSRYFVSQFAVNFAVGSAIGIGLLLIGLPHVVLWAALAAVLRFVPYVGVWLSAALAAALAAAVDPGWSLMVMTIGLFAGVELIAGQLVEPQLFGHSTGLSPLSVVIAAIFWSWIWGPIGLIVSTPLTLCLVVAGRHVKALAVFDILLGDTPALTMPQRFYQRALSGDSAEIISGARQYLRRRSFATYCDSIFLPALLLARLDFEAGTIREDQQIRIRSTVMEVIEALGSETRKPPARKRRESVLELPNLGQQLRHARERATGPWQGPLSVPAGSVIICIGLGATADDLMTEILVRVLRDQAIDARHLSIDDLTSGPTPGASQESVSMVWVVSADPIAYETRGDLVRNEVTRRFPAARALELFLPRRIGEEAEVDPANARAESNVTSFAEAAQICLDWQGRGTKTDASTGI